MCVCVFLSCAPLPCWVMFDLCYSEPGRSQWSAGGLLRDCEADTRDWRLRQYRLWVYFQEGGDNEKYPAHAHHCHLGADAVQVSDAQAKMSWAWEDGLIDRWMWAPSEASLPGLTKVPIASVCHVIRSLHRLANQDGGFTPKKYFSIDRVFRNEAMDATHLCEFHQVIDPCFQSSSPSVSVYDTATIL